MFGGRRGLPGAGLVEDRRRFLLGAEIGEGVVEAVVGEPRRPSGGRSRAAFAGRPRNRGELADAAYCSTASSLATQGLNSFGQMHVQRLVGPEGGEDLGRDAGRRDGFVVGEIVGGIVGGADGLHVELVAGCRGRAGRRWPSCSLACSQMRAAVVSSSSSSMPK